MRECTEIPCAHFTFLNPCGLISFPTPVITASGSVASFFSSFLPWGTSLSQIFRTLGRSHLDTEACITLSFRSLNLLQIKALEPTGKSLFSLPWADTDEVHFTCLCKDVLKFQIPVVGINLKIYHWNFFPLLLCFSFCNYSLFLLGEFLPKNTGSFLRIYFARTQTKILGTRNSPWKQTFRMRFWNDMEEITPLVY